MYARGIALDKLQPASRKRSVYLPIVRDYLPEVFQLFDFPDPSLVSGKRASTTVPTQALYLRNSAFKVNGVDHNNSADLTGQANHLGVTIQADIIKQKQAENNGGFTAINFAKTSKLVYENLTTDYPIDLTRYQIAGCYMGRIGLINSGGSSGDDDFRDAARTAVINKRAGGMGLISGRKAFQRPMSEGIKLLNTIQDVYLDESITVA